MCVDRRGFMQVAAGAAGASLLVSRDALSEETPLPFLPEIDEAIGHGLATLEKVEVRFYRHGED